MLIKYLNCDQVDKTNIKKNIDKICRLNDFKSFISTADKYIPNLSSLIEKLKKCDCDYKNMMKLLMDWQEDCKAFIPLFYIIHDFETFTISDKDKYDKYEYFAYILLLFDENYAYLKKDVFTNKFNKLMCN